MRFLSLILMFLIFPLKINAQSFIEGRVLDAQTNEPLISAGIQAINSQTGAITDLDGKFRIPVQNTLTEESLIIRYVGYKEQVINLRIPASFVIISLVPKEIEIGDVIILPQENPALRLIRLANENCKGNHPERLPFFSYQSYNKMIFFPTPTHKQFEKRFENESDRVKDSLYKTIHLLLWESVTERKYKFKGKSKESVMASKISGLQDMALPFSPTDIQDLSFYDDWVKILEVNFLSPISKSGINKYRYELKDTLILGSDTIYTISFAPRKETFNGFTGNLKLHTKKYAIQSIEANLHINDQLPLISNIKIKQIHQLINDTIWFPYQLNTDFQINPNQKSDGNTLTAYVRSSIQNVDLITIPSDKIFNPVVLDVAENAGKVNENDWKRLRPDTLNSKEKNTYKMLDSLGKKFNLSKILTQLDKLSQGALSIKYVDFYFRYLYNYNPVEKHRIGLGLGTNEKILKWANIMGWFGYGTSDDVWKRGATLSLHPFKNPHQRLNIEYEYNLVGLGTNYLGFQARKPLYRRLSETRPVRQFFFPWMDYVERTTANLFIQTGYRFQHQISLQTEHRTSAYEYKFDGNKSFRFTELSLTTRWGIGEKYYFNGFRNVALPIKNPVFELRVTKGLNNFLNGQFDYQKAEISVSHTLDMKGKGKFMYLITAGIIDRRVPLSRYYFFFANSNPNIIAEPFGFNTMSFKDQALFIADRYATLHLNWQIPNNWFPFKRFSPDPSIKTALGWGALKNDTKGHESFAFQTPKQGYYEVGLSLTNIIPPFLLEVLPSLQFMGIGCYMRLGAYALPKIEQNIVLKIEYLFQF